MKITPLKKFIMGGVLAAFLLITSLQFCDYAKKGTSFLKFDTSYFTLKTGGMLDRIVDNLYRNKVTPATRKEKEDSSRSRIPGSNIMLYMFSALILAGKSNLIVLVIRAACFLHLLSLNKIKAGGYGNGIAALKKYIRCCFKFATPLQKYIKYIRNQDDMISYAGCRKGLMARKGTRTLINVHSAGFFYV